MNVLDAHSRYASRSYPGTAGDRWDGGLSVTATAHQYLSRVRTSSQFPPDHWHTHLVEVIAKIPGFGTGSKPPTKAQHVLLTP